MDLTFESRDGVLLAKARGGVSLPEAIGVFTKACDLAAERGLNRILVDCLSVEGELSTMERYELGRTVAEYCNSRSMTSAVATVGKPPVVDGFGALVAWNRGLVVKTFSESQEAMDWLIAVYQTTLSETSRVHQVALVQKPGQREVDQLDRLRN